MNQQLDAYPPAWRAIAYAVLGLGWLSVVVFLVLYCGTRPWFRSEMGRHLVAFTACVGGFFTLYLALGIWPDLPFAGALRITLLFAIVAVCVWRLVLYLRTVLAGWRGRRG